MCVYMHTNIHCVVDLLREVIEKASAHPLKSRKNNDFFEFCSYFALNNPQSSVACL